MKLFFRIIRKFKYICSIVLLKLEYGNQLVLGKRLTNRSGLRITIAEKAKVEIGDNVFFNNDCSINAKRRICIGDNCIFGEGVKLYDHNHRFRNQEIPVYKQGYKESEIMIGKNCWLGSNVVILYGTTIGDNCVIGAGCVVSGKIPSGSIVRNKQNQTIEKRVQ